MQSVINDSTFRFNDPEGYEIFVYRWGPPDGKPAKAVVQIEHGAAERALRYERVARVLNQAGYVVYADDHRGHWKTAETMDNAGICGSDGWDWMVRDAKQLTGIIKDNRPGLPVFLFGHSMCSFMAQQYIQNWGEELSGVILSGSTGLSLVDASIVPMAEQAAQGEAANQPSELFAELFASVNAPFELVKTTPKSATNLGHENFLS